MARKTVKKSQVEKTKSEAVIEAIPTETVQKVNTDLLVPEPVIFEDKKNEPVEVKKEVKPAKAKKAANDKVVKKNTAVKKTKAEKTVETTAPVAEEKNAKTVKEKKADKPAKKTVSKAEKKPTPKSKIAENKSAINKVVPVELQFRNGNYTSEQIAEMCRTAYKNSGGKQIRTLEVYVNAAEAKAFYVVNGKNADKNGNVYSIDL